jgi:hypothetical protein
MQPIKFELAINLKTAKALGAMVLLVLPSEDHLWIGRHPGQFARLHEDAGMLALGPSCVPAAAQLNREWFSVARIRLDSHISMRPFKGIICDHI